MRREPTTLSKLEGYTINLDGEGEGHGYPETIVDWYPVSIILKNLEFNEG